ncbi:MAG TPA: hypothetical protein G4O00_01785 [Thermoflexia bacterium]|jgi:hypothetical protein|nr:hypothetical protein [Thermoflexia bacterium]
MRKTVVLLLFLVLLTVPALAQSGGGYDLSWWTVDGGGWTFSTGGGYALGGTIGQADPGEASGGTYTLLGGFWPSGATAGSKVYLPLILRNFP